MLQKQPKNPAEVRRRRRTPKQCQRGGRCSSGGGRNGGRGVDRLTIRPRFAQCRSFFPHTPTVRFETRSGSAHDARHAKPRVAVRCSCTADVRDAGKCWHTAVTVQHALLGHSLWERWRDGCSCARHGGVTIRQSIRRGTDGRGGRRVLAVWSQDAGDTHGVRSRSRRQHGIWELVGTRVFRGRGSVRRYRAVRAGTCTRSISVGERELLPREQ